MKRFAVALVAVVAMSASAQAGVEIGGTAGVHLFSESNSLGTPNTTIHQANSAMFGIRLGYYFSDMLGAELEGGLIPTESSGGNVVFDIYDATARAQLVAQFRSANAANDIVPFVSVGGGETRVVKIGTNDSSLFKKDDMRAHAFVGVGAKYRAGGGWGVRVDARALFVHDNTGKAFTNDFEILATLYREWGRKKAVKVDEPKKAADSDADDIEDSVDKCPKEAEDKDGFQDDDGCPDPDNDSDGVPDAADKCADAAETRNGFEDDDGCADELPAKLQKIVGPIAGVSFKANSADLTPASNKALDAVAAALTEFTSVKVEIGAHTDDQPLKAGGKFADNDALTQAQADAVKAYLVKKGVAEDQVTTKGYGSTKPVTDPTGLKGAKLAAARKANRRVELTLVVAEAAGEAKPAEATPPPPAPEADKKPEEGGAEPKTDEKK